MIQLYFDPYKSYHKCLVVELYFLTFEDKKAY